jgi:hypothetical protein
VTRRIKKPIPVGTTHVKTPPAPPSPDHQKPHFCLACIQEGYSIADCTSEQRASYANKLAKWSELTWIEIQASNKHGLGCEPINDILVALPAHVPEDASLIAFRFHEHLAVTGFRTERVFHAVWFDRDPKGKIYRH